MNTPASGRAPLVPRLTHSAWVVLGGDFVSAVGSGLTLPCLLIYVHRIRGLGYGTSGLVLATVALASVVGNPVGGAAADRWTSRLTLIAGLVVAAGGSIAVAFAADRAELFAAAAILGFGVAMIWPAQNALLASVADAGDTSAVFSVRHATLNAGLGLGALGAASFVRVAHPGTFLAIFVIDAASYLAFIPVLARLDVPVDSARAHDRAPSSVGYRAALKDTVFLRVWALTALIVLVSYGQFQSSFAAFATRPGGIDTQDLGLAFAANTLTIVAAQLFVLRRLRGHRRTTAAGWAGVAWAVTWAIVMVGGHLGRGVPAVVVFAGAAMVFAVGESLLSPTLPVIVNDIAPSGAQGRYNGLGVLAFSAGFVIGPAAGGAALGAGWGAGLFAVLIVACVLASLGAFRLDRYLPPEVNKIVGL